jgi:hypothetical protein
MRIINVIVLHAGILHTINSYPVIDEQLSQEVVDQAEDEFRNFILTTGTDDDIRDIESFVEEGYFENSNYDSIFLAWSTIEGV